MRVECIHVCVFVYVSRWDCEYHGSLLDLRKIIACSYTAPDSMLYSIRLSSAIPRIHHLSISTHIALPYTPLSISIYIYILYNSIL